MCRENKEFLILLFVSLLLSLVVGALQGEERWYLISETELLSIEQYRTTSEREKQNSLLQVQNLKTESTNLNVQLSQARELQRKSDQLFNEYEKDQLTLIASKNGEIAELKQELADEKMEKEKHKRISQNRMVIIIAMACVFGLFLAFLIWRKLHR